MGWRLSCCSCRDIEITQETDQDDDEQESVFSLPQATATRNSLQSCKQYSPTCESESGMSKGEDIAVDSIDQEGSCFSSINKNAFGSVMKWFEQGVDKWEVREIPPQGIYCVTDNPVYRVCESDGGLMQERYAALLLGDDITGGSKGLSASLALSKAIANLAASVFGELWRLEPLPEERKSTWRTEMDWLLAPTKYMVELVPSKRSGANGLTMEIMTPKARADIHDNLPALQKLDYMLIEALDSMVSTEFWYTEGCRWAEGRSRSTNHMRRWLVPMPQLPIAGLSQNERAKMLNLGKQVHQIFKAAKSTNESILLQMPVPALIKNALPKSGKESLGEELYRILSVDSQSVSQVLNSLNLKSEHSAVETINRLEAAVFAWKEKVTKLNRGKTPAPKAWSFKTDPVLELEKMEVLMDKAEALIQLLKTMYPNLPRTFLEVLKIQYGKDVGHSILEAYSRVLRNLAFNMLCRIRDILEEDALCNPHLHVPTYLFPGTNATKNAKSPVLVQRARHSHIEKMNRADEGEFPISSTNFTNSLSFSRTEQKTSSVVGTPSWSGVWRTLGIKHCSGVYSSSRWP